MSKPFVSRDQWKQHAVALSEENASLLKEQLSLRAEVERFRAGNRLMSQEISRLRSVLDDIDDTARELINGNASAVDGGNRIRVLVASDQRGPR